MLKDHQVNIKLLFCTAIITPLSFLIFACDGGSDDSDTVKSRYINRQEKDNTISYNDIKNTRGVYITSMCYTKTQDSITAEIFNPCYSCHTNGKVPNFYSDTALQMEYNFPLEVRTNPFTNLFKDRGIAVAAISNAVILEYVRQSNYFDGEGAITLDKALPESWKGYRPDSYFNFDNEGFDHNKNNDYTGWRAFRYTPFLGTFWPTNGSTDDVLIRLDRPFREDPSGDFNLLVYKLNLAIVEAIVKDASIQLPEAIDENLYGVDLNGDGVLTSTSRILPSVKSYVGRAKGKLNRQEIHLAKGLFPENTEFLHSVRYLDWNDTSDSVQMSARMKELRYAKKYTWSTYSELERVALAEQWEMQSLDSNEAQLSVFRGDYEAGLKNEIGWVYQGFIEDKKGDLRPQTHEESIACMGCHSHLGATTDSVFAFPRKLEGIAKSKTDYGWNHWSQKGLAGIKEPRVKYKNIDEQYEYSFYLKNNHSGNEFRNNQEVIDKFFDQNGNIKPSMLQKLHNDISVLLLPSRSRALQLNKAYKVTVGEQSYIYGRDANIKPISAVFETIKPEQKTGIRKPLVR